MQRHRKALLSAVLLTACLSAKAQTSDLPSAPVAMPNAPAPTAPGKPSFALPPPKLTPPTGPPPDPKKVAVCDAPPEGIYTKANQDVPPTLKGVVGSYLRNVYSEIFNDWDHHMSLGEKNAWGKGRMVEVRFAIFPDGSYDPPVVTVSSGKETYDNHALNAVNSHASFPPPPAGIKKPIPICIKVGYNLPPTSEWPRDTPEWMLPPKPKQP